MATSGSINYSTSSQEIIIEALELLGVLGEGQQPTDAQYTSALRTLNMMTKAWQADSLNIFAVQKLYLFLILGQQQYDLSSTTQDHFTSRFGQQVTVGDVLTGSTTITVEFGSDVSIGMYIGVAITGTEVQWTTVANVAGDIITLSEALTEDVVEGSIVYYYLAKANRPMRIMEAYNHRGLGNTDIPMGMFPRVEYYSLSKKDTVGQSVQLYLDSQIGTSHAYVWPTNNSELDYLILLCQRTLSDFDTLTDEPDYPQEWYRPLAYNLAVSLAPKFGTPNTDYQRLWLLAKDSYELARGYDVEQDTSVYLKPDTWGSDIGRRGG
jgi:hypothetical protein